MTNECKVAGNLHKYNFIQADIVYSVDGVCPTIMAHLQGQMGHQIQILEESNEPSRAEAEKQV